MFWIIILSFILVPLLLSGNDKTVVQLVTDKDSNKPLSTAFRPALGKDNAWTFKSVRGADEAYRGLVRLVPSSNEGRQIISFECDALQANHDDLDNVMSEFHIYLTSRIH